MKFATRIFASFLLICGAMSACSELKDLGERVESLEGRVQALETLIPALNSNIDAVKNLMNCGSITSATEKNGVWTIVLNDGTVLTLTQGSIGVGNAPVMSVDKDGYWMVDYGTGATYVLMNGEKVSAVGKDGITPLFGVSAAGNWTVSYDGGKTFADVKDTEDKSVSALPSGEQKDPYFEDIVLSEDSLEITLRGGESFTVPVLKDFMCSINAEGIQAFTYGETKAFNVTMKGVRSTMITTPAGWKASLSAPVEGNTVLSVSAPEAAVKSVIADSGADVCILAFSASNVAAIAKVSVSLTDAPVTATPVATVAAGEATDSSLSFNVTVVNATSWKYLLVKEGEAAPEASVVAAEGIEGTSADVTIGDLEELTAYVLYVLPFNEEEYGAMAECRSTTAEKTYANLFDRYMDGKDIVAGGVIVNLATYGEAVIIRNDSENKTLADTGVYFIDPEAENVQMVSAKKLVVISLDGRTATISKASQSTIVPSAEADCFIMQNIRYVTGMTSGNMFGGGKVEEVYETVAFDGCHFDIPKDMTFMYAQLPVDELIVSNCDIRLHATTSDKSFWQTNTASTYKSVVFSNNIFYCADGDVASYRLFFNGNATITSLEFKNNTIASVYPKATAGYVHAKHFTAADASLNLFYIPNYTACVGEKYTGMLYSNKDNTGLTMNTNLAQYGESIPSERLKAHYQHNEGTVYNKKTSDGDPFATADFENGVFTTVETYKAYGAKR